MKQIQTRLNLHLPDLLVFSIVAVYGIGLLYTTTVIVAVYWIRLNDTQTVIVAVYGIERFYTKTVCAERELFKIEFHGFVFVSKSELISYSQTASYKGMIMLIPFIYISEYQQQYLNKKMLLTFTTTCNGHINVFFNLVHNI